MCWEGLAAAVGDKGALAPAAARIAGSPLCYLASYLVAAVGQVHLLVWQADGVVDPAAVHAASAVDAVRHSAIPGASVICKSVVYRWNSRVGRQGSGTEPFASLWHLLLLQNISRCRLSSACASVFQFLGYSTQDGVSGNQSKIRAPAFAGQVEGTAAVWVLKVLV